MSNPFIKIIGNGFEVHRGHERLATIHWAEIENVTAFKRDLFTIDLICFNVCWGNPSMNIELNEEEIGFDELEKSMHSYLPGFDRDWWTKVAMPAFKINETVIFSRPK